jgi:hypothetical protein
MQFSCNTTDPKLEPELKLELKDVSCTEAWLQFSITNIQIPNNISLLINGNVAKTFNLNTQDSLLYIDSLLPNQSYKFKIVINTTNNPQPTTNEVLAQTLDTTSHNFTWQTFTFGEHSSSTLYDVAIINENNIWAVGEIYMSDTLGNPDPMPYNAAHWSGSDWELKKIVVTYNGNETIAPLKGIFVLPSGEIIFSSGLPYLPQGNGWKLYHLWDMGVLDQNDGSVDRIWGTSINDLYFVGGKGTIVHYQNGSWKKIESGTEINLNTITSDLNSNEKWISGYSIDFSKSIILKLNNLTTSKVWEKQGLNTPPYGGLVQCVWNTGNILFVLSTDGVFRKNTKLDLLPQQLSSNSTWKYNITGSNQNDVYTSGDYSIVMHYNGVSWKKIHQLYSNTSSFYSATVKEKIFIGVGTIVEDVVFHKALLIIGKRL